MERYWDPKSVVRWIGVVRELIHYFILYSNGVFTVSYTVELMKSWDHTTLRSGGWSVRPHWMSKPRRAEGNEMGIMWKRNLKKNYTKADGWVGKGKCKIKP